MNAGPNIAIIAAAIGDPVRAFVLLDLMNGGGASAGALALRAGITPQTMSTHLARLSSCGLIVIESKGRNRFCQLASQEVAAALEAMMPLAAMLPSKAKRRGPADPEMRHARLCYDHLAGEMGVALADAFFEAGWIAPNGDAAMLTAKGERLCQDKNLVFPSSRRPMVRLCLDWSEGRPHIAGQLGAAIAAYGLQHKWWLLPKEGRRLTITSAGRLALRQNFGVKF